MDRINVDQNLRALQSLFPGQFEGHYELFNFNKIKDIPLWIKASVQLIVVIPTHGSSIYFLIPKPNLSFEQLQHIHGVLVDKIQNLVLVIADQMPAKHRPLLVKFRIPFIFKEESVFAPELGVKFGKIKRFNTETKLNIEKIKEQISPFALKIVAGLLTKKIPNEFKQKSLYEQISIYTKISQSKLSSALKELVKCGILKVNGSGPHKTLVQTSAQNIFEIVFDKGLDQLYRTIESNFLPKSQNHYVKAGENALAQHSNLATSSQLEIAVIISEFRKTFEGRKNKGRTLNSDKPIIVQIWKEDPHLFSIKGTINPIEIFFSLQHHHDERVQLSLEEMLAYYELRKPTKEV